MSSITIYEFDALTSATSNFVATSNLHGVPAEVYKWLEHQCLRATDDGGSVWLRLGQKNGRRVVQVTSFVGVIRSPSGFQIEVLPKIGKVIGGGVVQARQLLIDMLCALREFRHVHTGSAKISAARMPLLEVFIVEFLREVDKVIKLGLRRDYSSKQDNLFALKGKLLVAQHARQNLHRADRFFTEHDEFLTDRPENRLLHSALQHVLTLSTSQQNQRQARQLQFLFANIPASTNPIADFHRVQPTRGMEYYTQGLMWARLILGEDAPLTGIGKYTTPSWLFPMEAVFEAFVAIHLAKQLKKPFALKTQVRTQHLVRHRERNWFRMQPDLLIHDNHNIVLVLDTKWKLLDELKIDGATKYGLSQSDFYQLQAYGHSYLEGKGDVVLIYPKTDAFKTALPVFDFPKPGGLRLWVLPFCLSSRQICWPDNAPFIDLQRRSRGM